MILLLFKPSRLAAVLVTNAGFLVLIKQVQQQMKVRLVTAGRSMRYSAIKKSQGLTLLELLITLAIIIICASIGVPSYSTFMANERFATASNELYNAYRFAREEAIKTSSPMTLAASGAAWTVKDSGDTLLFVSKSRHSTVTVSSTSSTVTVQGMGSVSGGLATFTISGAYDNKCLRILSSGQSQVEEGGC